MTKSSDIIISAEFEHALELMENTNEHVFITGRAGTGKSTLLRYFRNHTAKEIVVLAPTGIAAINVMGQTIHSFFGFPPYPDIFNHIGKRRNRKIYENLDAIIIDEVSMVRADMIDAIDKFMRINGLNKHLPFGGVQMIFIGDLFQLPPVVSSDVEKRVMEFLYETPFFYSANSFYNYKLHYVELTTVYRQKDRGFLQLLDNIRTKELDEYTLESLNQNYHYSFRPAADDYFITLCSTNKIAKRINDQQLGRLPHQLFEFEAKVEGDIDDRSLPTDDLLELKEDAQVMFVKNDPDGRWVNGTLGRIVKIDLDLISVAIEQRIEDNGNGEIGEEDIYHIEKTTWEIVKYDYDDAKNKITTKVVGRFTQYPIKLAWAITIHKSQGKTFDNIIVDIGRGAFAPGQIYVALSRCTTLEGIILRQKIRYRDIIIDERILEFAKNNGLYDS